MTQARAGRARLARVAALATALALVAMPPAEAAKRRRKKRAPEPTAVPRPRDPFRVNVQTPDGVVLAASWRPLPDAPKAPAVLLIHDFSRERREWESIAPDLAARGLATLAIDLRAHGESTHRGSVALRLTPHLLGDPNGFPRDVQAACTWLKERAPRVGVMGMSIGGDLAVLATAQGWADAGVSISANVDRLVPLAGGRPIAGRAMLFLAAEDDPQRAASARAMLDAAKEPKKLQVYAGAAHNFVLLSEHPEAKAAALDWLAAQLGIPRTSPTPAPTP